MQLSTDDLENIASVAEELFVAGFDHLLNSVVVDGQYKVIQSPRGSDVDSPSHVIRGIDRYFDVEGQIFEDKCVELEAVKTTEDLDSSIKVNRHVNSFETQNKSIAVFRFPIE